MELLKDNQVLLSRKAKILLLAAYLLPVILLFGFVTTFGVNVPYWDQWELVELFQKFASGNLTFLDLFAQHNEHRIFFPKIVFATLAFISNWNIRFELYFNISLGIINFLLIYKIAAKNKGTNEVLFHCANILTCVLIFSWIQYENWLWGFQISWFLINTCVISGIFFLTVPQNLSPNWKFLFSSLFCFIASFSSAHGLLSWLAIIPSVITLKANRWQKRGIFLGWVVLFILSFSIYRIGYQKPGHHPDVFFFLEKPSIAGTYLLTILGSPIGGSPIPSAISGLIIIISFLFFNFFCLRNWRSQLINSAAPWISMGWFALLFALITTLGRAGFGVEQALSSRYTSVSILLIIALLHLSKLFISYRQPQITNDSRLLSKIATIVSSILIVVFIFTSTSSIPKAEKIQSERTRGGICLEAIYFFDNSISQSPDTCLSLLYPSVDRLMQLAKVLDGLGLRNFPKHVVYVTNPTEVHGYIDSPSAREQPASLPKDGNIKVLGWAILPNQRDIPKVIFLSSGDDRLFFASGVVRLSRPDVAKALGSTDFTQTGWEAHILAKAFPVGDTVAEAWVYDQEAEQFVKLKGELRIKVME